MRNTIMGKRHEDISYLMGDEIGGVICMGLADTVEAKPKNPVEFFAKWLLNYRMQQRATDEVSLSVQL